MVFRIPFRSSAETFGPLCQVIGRIENPSRRLPTSPGHRTGCVYLMPLGEDAPMDDWHFTLPLIQQDGVGFLSKSRRSCIDIEKKHISGDSFRLTDVVTTN